MTVTLKKWSWEYAPAVAEFANNPKIAENLRDGFPQPYTRKDAQAYIKSCLERDDENQLCRAVLADGAFAGSIGIFLRENGGAELGYWLGEPFWGRGITARAVEQLCAAAFARFPIRLIYAVPYEDNLRSRRVLEKAGFRHEGPSETEGCSRGPVCRYTRHRPGASAGEPPMRRRDRQITDRDELLAVLERCPVLRLGLSDDGTPYVVPLNFAFRAQGSALTLYFHCAAEGRKLDILARNPRVCFEVDGAFELVNAERACDMTARFESVIGFGTASVILSEAEKTEAMDALVLRYGFHGKPSYEAGVFAHTRMVKIEVTELTGKRHL